jgi:hypothetical protein
MDLAQHGGRVHEVDEEEVDVDDVVALIRLSGVVRVRVDPADVRSIQAGVRHHLGHLVQAGELVAAELALPGEHGQV